MKTLNQKHKPFGIAWRKEMIKLTKPQLIDMYKKTCLEKIELENLLTLKNKQNGNN